MSTRLDLQRSAMRKWYSLHSMASCRWRSWSYLRADSAHASARNLCSCRARRSINRSMSASPRWPLRYSSSEILCRFSATPASSAWSTPHPFPFGVGQAEYENARPSALDTEPIRIPAPLSIELSAPGTYAEPVVPRDYWPAHAPSDLTLESYVATPVPRREGVYFPKPFPIMHTPCPKGQKDRGRDSGSVDGL